MIFLEKCT